ncbi:serine/threonine-protein kinase Nek1 [Chanos chanos]|uniref:non-specific serine/threonine protein kinase n=1 Tax=Chanos chanos TaxID=29144 RepID=A0A6J2V858_CHACN|nr:serine/threonine-protein kinase Nek1 [Chanos chanos]
MEKYEKLKKIGEGSFGKAILVKSREDGRQYVIKEIGISRMSSKERQESRKEVAVLANMSHPNIVQYKESFEENGCLYIVMDYCEGGDLFKKINNQKGVLFHEEQILDWFVQICLALKHVHDRKILHRDIKSQNIFLTKDGTIQLGDFGIARVLNSTVELARTCIGTPYYLSPEICENKPYNNKSDIWALGCVLYEMCTLKHAFEAGNMKNLVLKIIRGSYPPVSVHYSQDLRSLLGQLFKRSPRERPSVSAILDKPFLSRRIHKFLTPQLIAQEFSHSLHLKQPKMAEAQGTPAKRPAPSPAPIAPAHKITKPAAKYGVPLTVRRTSDGPRKVVDPAKKPVERKPVAKHKQAPLPAAAQRRVSRVEEERRKYEEGMRKKRLEQMEKEKKQREQMFLLKAAQIKRFEREKLNRINRAREQGWRHVLSSSGGSSPERKFYGGGGMVAAPAGPPPGPTPLPGPAHVPPPPPGPTPGLAPSKAQYDHFHAELDQLSKVPAKEGLRDGAVPGGEIPGRSAVEPELPNGQPCPTDQDTAKRELRRIEQVTKNATANRQRAQIAAERAKQVEEFLQRKKEAMLNKVRAEGQLEYLARLKQIRLQNFNERQQIKARLRGEKYDSDGSDSQESCEEAELRRKKIEALKAQSKARAAVLKEQLEKKRREAYEREKKAWEEHLVARGVKVSAGAGGGAAPPFSGSPPQADSAPQETAVKATPSSRPTTPAISMTAALKDVGAVASGQSSPMKEESPKTETSVTQSEKKDILRRLNQNLIPLAAEEEKKKEEPLSNELQPVPDPNKPVTDEEAPPPAGDRRKWEAGAPPLLSVKEQTLGETGTLAVSPEERLPSGGDRRKWQAVAPPVLSVAQQTLEDTGFTTPEQTAGEVIRMEAWQGQGQGLRRTWGRSPDSEVLKVLEEAELQPLTQHLGNTSICDNTITDGLKSSVGPSDDADGVKLVTNSQPRLPDVVQNEGAKGQEERSIDSEVKSQEIRLDSAEETLKTHVPTESQIDVTEDLEAEVLEEKPQPMLKPSGGVVEAWGQEAPPLGPAEGSTAPSESREETQREEKQAVPSGQDEEPLFVKICSPAHRRTVALSLLSAQSSVEDSSSSVASRSRSISPLRSKQQNTLLIGLSTGLFDANNPKMLRTCSLPDLSKLFSSTEASSAVAPDNHMNIEDLEEDGKGDEQSEAEDVYEDEDLRELRASMERLLQEQRSEEDDGDSNGSPGDEHSRDLNGLDDIKKHRPACGASPEDEDGEAEGLNDIAGEDDDDDDDDGSPEDEAGGPLTNGMEEEEDEDQRSYESHLNEEWHSDDGEDEEEDDEEQQDSIFSRLEELRFQLEQAMGFEKFIEAYNKIKAIHEDEDENIDMGSGMVRSILGTEHQHLYPNILHLVMADGAYQEVNVRRMAMIAAWE